MPSPFQTPLWEFAPKISLPNYHTMKDPVFIHCCKDGTCSLRRKDEPVFNDVALCVYIVDGMEPAAALQVTMCFNVGRSHPSAEGSKFIWYKFNDIRQMKGYVFEVEHLKYLTAKIHACHQMINERKRAG